MKLVAPKKTKIVFCKMKPQALTPRVLTAFDDDDNDKSLAKEMWKQVLQDTLDQPLQESVSVKGHLRTGLFSLYIKTANVNTISLEPQIMTDRAKT